MEERKNGTLKVQLEDGETPAGGAVPLMGGAAAGGLRQQKTRVVDARVFLGDGDGCRLPAARSLPRTVCLSNGQNRGERGSHAAADSGIVKGPLGP